MIRLQGLAFRATTLVRGIHIRNAFESEQDFIHINLPDHGTAPKQQEVSQSRGYNASLASRPAHRKPSVTEVSQYNGKKKRADALAALPDNIKKLMVKQKEGHWLNAVEITDLQNALIAIPFNHNPKDLHLGHLKTRTARDSPKYYGRLPAIRPNSQPTSGYSKLKPLSLTMAAIFRQNKAPSHAQAMVWLWGKQTSAYLMRPLDFPADQVFNAKHHTGRLLIPSFRHNNELIESSTNHSYMLERHYRRIIAMCDSGQELHKKHIKALGRMLPEKLKKYQTNLQDRKEIPFEYVEHFPQKGTTKVHKHVMKYYTRMYDENRMYNTSMLIRELGLKPEDLKHYKRDEMKYGRELYRHARGSAHQRFVWSRDLGLAYAFREGNNGWAKANRVLNEIRARDAEFHPRSVLDIGCGVGTGYRSAKYVFRNSTFSYTGVDKSRDMLTVCGEMLVDSNPMVMTPSEVVNRNVRNRIFMQQNIPKNHSFDLVMMIDVLWDMPCNNDRYEALYKAWRATDKYLVIIDRGGKEGHWLTQLARGFILSQGRWVKKLNNIIGKHGKFDEGYTYAPCPHDRPCKSESPCFFESRVSLMGERARQSYQYDASNVQDQNYTYVILKKGNRKHNLQHLNAKLKSHNFPTDFHGETFESMHRQDSRALQGELPWPRLLSIKNRDRGKLEAVYHQDNHPNLKTIKGARSDAPGEAYKIKAARICLPTGDIYEGQVHARDVSRASFLSLIHTRFGDRIPWFNFNTYKQWEWNYNLVQDIKKDRWIFNDVVATKLLGDLTNRQILEMMPTAIISGGVVIARPNDESIVEVPEVLGEFKDMPRWDELKKDGIEFPETNYELRDPMSLVPTKPELVKKRLGDTNKYERQWMHEQIVGLDKNTVVKYLIREKGSDDRSATGSYGDPGVNLKSPKPIKHGRNPLIGRLTPRVRRKSGHLKLIK